MADDPRSFDELMARMGVEKLGRKTAKKTPAVQEAPKESPKPQPRPKVAKPKASTWQETTSPGRQDGPKARSLPL